MDFIKPNKDIMLVSDKINGIFCGKITSAEKDHYVVKIDDELEKVCGLHTSEVLITQENSVARFVSRVIKIEDNLVYLSMPEKVKFLQHREAPRIDISVPVILKIGNKEVGACSTNISAGGMQIICFEKADLRAIYNIEFYLFNNKRIRTLFEILRVSPKNNYYNISGRYKWFSKMDRTAVVHLCFKHHIELICKKARSNILT